MTEWVLSEEHHRDVVALLEQARASVAVDPRRLSLSDFRALTPSERTRQWYATWTPYYHETDGRAWDCLIQQLADGHWHRFNDVREAMVAAGPLNWRHAKTLLYTGVRAGALEEFRWGGSRSYLNRRIRLHEQCPERLRPGVAARTG